MKKLLVTASTFPRWKDDTEPKFIYDLCKEYTKYYDVTVLVPSAPGAKKKENMEGIKVVRYRYFPIKKFETLAYPGAIVPRIKEKKIRALLVPFFFLSMYFSLAREISKNDIVHSNWLIPQGIIQGFFKKPFILTGLGGDVTSLNTGIIKKIKAQALAKASAITVVSEDLKKVLESEYGVSDVDVIPMGVDLTEFSPSNHVDNYFGQKNKPVILFVGRLVEKKGTAYLIEAMRGIDAILIIVGDGPERNRLQDLADSIDADIRFVGPKNKSELAILNASCDIFCAPSVMAKDGDKDGLPVAIIEAMASGVPVVASDIGGIQEAIHNNENGFLVECKNIDQLTEKINTLLKDPELLSRMKLASRETAKLFDFSKIGLRYKKLLDKI